MLCISLKPPATCNPASPYVDQVDPPFAYRKATGTSGDANVANLTSPTCVFCKCGREPHLCPFKGVPYSSFSTNVAAPVFCTGLPFETTREKEGPQKKKRGRTHTLLASSLPRKAPAHPDSPSDSKIQPSDSHASGGPAAFSKGTPGNS